MTFKIKTLYGSNNPLINNKSLMFITVNSNLKITSASTKNS